MNTLDHERLDVYQVAMDTECAASLDVCRGLEMAEEPLLPSGREHILRLVSMLTRFVKRETKSGTGTSTGLYPKLPIVLALNLVFGHVRVRLRAIRIVEVKARRRRRCNGAYR
jgi:hypothetical protein